MPLPLPRPRATTTRVLLALPALALSTALLTGCGDRQARSARELDQALSAALADYESVATSHLAGDKKGVPAVAYKAPTANSGLPDLSLLAERQDAYDSLAARFKELAGAPGASGAQQATAWNAVAQIQARGARFLVRRAELDRATYLRLCADLHSTLGKIEAEAITRQPVPAQNVIPLIEQGESAGFKTSSLAELTKIREAGAAEIEKSKAKVDASDSDKKAARAKADELFAKAQELELSVHRAHGKERFDLMDQASMARRDAEIAESGILGQDLQLDSLNRQLQLLARNQVALDQIIAKLTERLDTAKKAQQDAGSKSAQNDENIAKLHDQWIAQAKSLDGVFTDKVDAPLAKAVLAAQAAQATLDKAEKAAAGQADLLPTLGLDKTGLAAGIAQAHVLRLRALESHKNALHELARREAVWAEGKDNSFVTGREAELSKTEAELAKTAATACTDALAAIAADTKDADNLGVLKANVEAYQKLARGIATGGGAAAEAPAAAPAPVAPKEEPKKEEPKADAQPAAQPETAPEAPKPAN